MKNAAKWVVILLVAGATVWLGCQPPEETTSEASEQALGLTGRTQGMVIDDATDSATVFDADTNTVLGTVQGLGSPGIAITGDCLISMDGTKGFFTRFNSTVTVADLTTTPPTLAGGRNPISLANRGGDTALSPDGKFLVSCSGVAPISVINVATQSLIGGLFTGFDCNSIDVCRDGSVLYTSLAPGRVRRLKLSETGVLTDTGQSQPVFDPRNVSCSPSAKFAIVADLSMGRATSFRVSPLFPAATRTISFVDSVAFNHAGDRAYFLASGKMLSFAFDQDTGVFGTTPLFQVATTANGASFEGIDGLMVHPSDASLYVAEPGRVRIFDAQTGDTIGSIVGESLSRATGICLGAAPPNQPPVARCTDRVVPADGTCHGEASIDDGSFDPDAGDAIHCTQVPSGPYGEGTTQTTLTCTDSHGASSSCSATVTVADQTPPVLACPADQTVECNDGRGGAAATFAAAAIDNCDGDRPVTCVPASGSIFPLGTTTDVCTASDASANTGQCSHHVTVIDTAPPIVITASPAPLWPPNHKYHRVDLGDCVTSIQDVCDGSLDVASHATVTACTSNEPDEGLGDGDAANDCVIVDRHSVDARAERAGGGNGRVYTIHFTVTDDAGNATDRTCTASVPHSQNGASAIDDATQTIRP